MRMATSVQVGLARALAPALLLAGAPVLRADTYVVRLDPSVVADGAPARGRLILFFITETGRRWQETPPIDGPFWDPPQPIASIDVSDLRPGGTVTIDGSSPAFPGPLDSLEGTVRVQAILDRDSTERSHSEGPGNLTSNAARVDLSAEADDLVELELVRRVEPRPLPPETSRLKWVEVRSALLSDFCGRDVFHRAGVVLPPDRQKQGARPAIYVIPGFGGRHEVALAYARMADSGRGRNMPRAVYVVLDPESPLGHHGFVDSPNHGPRCTALVTEFIPHLEERFDLAARPEARIVTGHSSGGWSSLWLQLQRPDVFGGCWSSAPDPVDFSAFQMNDLYAGGNLYVDGSGRELPSYRAAYEPGGLPQVRMTVRQECLMEYFMHPLGGSGQQWDAWEAMFSPRDPETSFPRPMFEPLTGAVDPEVVAQWARFDITRLVVSDWERYGPIVTGRVRLACGTQDSFYLDRAVARFRDAVARLAGEHGGPGYVWLVEGASHSSLERGARARFNREMIEHLRLHGLDE